MTDRKHILITGGASGIGAACARLAAQQGSFVIIADKQVDAATALAAELGGCAVQLDVSDETNVAHRVTEIFDTHRHVDGLIHCAGILQRPLPPDQLTMKEWDLVQQVDLRGVYVVAAAVGNRMVTQGHGALVLVASVAGMTSAPLHSYGPAKAGVIALAACLATEWGKAGVRVNALSPGFTETPALHKGMRHSVLSEQAMRDSSALGRLVRADEVAAAALFLISDQASAITGINLPVDAGYLVATPWQAYRVPGPEDGP